MIGSTSQRLTQHIHPAEQDRQPPVPGQDPEQNAPPGAHELARHKHESVQEGFELHAQHGLLLSLIFLAPTSGFGKQQCKPRFQPGQ